MKKKNAPTGLTVRPWHVYIIECSDGRLYTGMTNDLQRRFREHTSGRGGRFTRAFGACRMLYSEEQPSRPAAFRREAEIKRWPREKKLKLIAAGNREGGKGKGDN